jgi:hypothetical protein
MTSRTSQRIEVLVADGTPGRAILKQRSSWLRLSWQEPSAHRHSLNNPSRVAGPGVVTGHSGCAHAGRSAEADVTSSSEEKLGSRISTACPPSKLGPWSHRYGPAKLDSPGLMAVRRRGWKSPDLQRCPRSSENTHVSETWGSGQRREVPAGAWRSVAAARASRVRAAVPVSR